MSAVGAELTRIAREEAATVVCLGTPPGLELGLDLRAWTVGSRFRGIKLVPPGLRFLHYAGAGAASVASATAAPEPNERTASKDTNAAAAAARGLFVEVGASQVLGLRWSPMDEDFGALPEYELVGLTEAVHRLELDPSLGPYDPNRYDLWQSLTCHISRETLKRCNIELGCVILSGADLAGEPPGPAEGPSVRYCEARFTALPNLPELAKQHRSDGVGGGPSHFFSREDGSRLSASEITALQLDPTPLVAGLVRRCYAGSFAELWGEVELAFTLFVYLASLPGLEFWKLAVHLVSSCTTLEEIDGGEAALVDFIAMLSAQIQLLPHDLFYNDLLQDSFLRQSLGNLLAEEERLGAAQRTQRRAEQGASRVGASRVGAARASLRRAIRTQFGRQALAQLLTSERTEEEAFQAAAIEAAIHRDRGGAQASGLADLGAADVDSDVAMLGDEDKVRSTRTGPAALEREAASQARMGWMLPP